MSRHPARVPLLPSAVRRTALLLAIAAGALRASPAQAQAAPHAPVAAASADSAAAARGLPAPGTPVRVVLRRAELAPLQPVAGEPTNLNVDGTLVGIDSASVTIRTTTGERVTYPADGVRHLAIRRCGGGGCAQRGTRPLAFGIAGAIVGAIVGRSHTPAAFAVGGGLLGAVVGSLGGSQKVDIVPNWPPR